MFFKFSSNNPYRNLARNVRRVLVSSTSNATKLEALRELWSHLESKLYEDTRLLNRSAAYAVRCEHWNQRDSNKYSKVTRNPWLTLKHEVLQVLQGERTIRQLEQDLMWFYHIPEDTRNDFLVG